MKDQLRDSLLKTAFRIEAQDRLKKSRSHWLCKLLRRHVGLKVFSGGSPDCYPNEGSATCHRCRITTMVYLPIGVMEGLGWSSAPPPTGGSGLISPTSANHSYTSATEAQMALEAVKSVKEVEPQITDEALLEFSVEYIEKLRAENFALKNRIKREEDASRHLMETMYDPNHN